ncbi:MAG: toll/interleukin-1 receptor domain-containing protein [Hyphomonadaceae bacterium]
MTDVFISYKREEREHARRLAEALGEHGFAVWWDAEILPGEQYRSVTLQILESCRAALVIWSQRSIGSGWVLDEAQRALDRGVLIPVHFEPISAYPLGFGQVHAHDLVSWEGDVGAAKFRPVLAAVERLAGKRAPEPEAATQAAPAAVEAEVAFWRGVQDSRDGDDFAAYLARYPDGLFSDLARRRIAALQPPPLEQRAAQTPPRPQAFAAAPAHAPVWGALTAGGFTRWELGFVAVGALLLPFLLWPLVNLTIPGLRVFYGPDYELLLDPGHLRNVWFLTPLAVGAAWLYDAVERQVEQAAGKGVRRIMRVAIGAILLIAYVLAMRAEDDYGAHSVAWIAAIWGVAMIARRVTPWFKAKIEALTAR